MGPPRFGKDYKWYISGNFPANWGMDYNPYHLLGEPETAIETSSATSPIVGVYRAPFNKDSLFFRWDFSHPQGPRSFSRPDRTFGKIKPLNPSIHQALVGPMFPKLKC